MQASVDAATPDDLDELIALLRAYCEFYSVDPPEARLREMCEALLADPDEGAQLIARDADGTAIGFATVFWTWQTLVAARIGVMNDLYVVPEARGHGVADMLIEACAGLCAERGVSELCWQTALDNHRAQAVYERVGATSSRWLDYTLETDPGARAQLDF